MIFQELNNDQRRETVNSRQRFEAWVQAMHDRDRFKGSMVWAKENGTEYLVRSSYDPKTNIRRQTSLGPRSAEAETIKAEFERGRQRARERFAELDAVIERQASINRAVGITRVPLIGGKIIRALDAAGLLGKGIRVVGTNAIYAYEAVAGVFSDPGLTATEDLDLLFDARREIDFVPSEAVSERSLMAVLRKVDRSFERDRVTFRAVNRDGYLVDFIKPAPKPPWKRERETISESEENDLVAAGIEGLEWLVNSPPFDSIVIDESGWPARMIAPDPRVYAIHKLRLSGRSDRQAVQRKRDRAQAELVGQLVCRYLPHLPYDASELKMLPIDLTAGAKPLFEPTS